MSQEHTDDELRGLGMAAVHEHEVSVSAAETESALHAGRAVSGGERRRCHVAPRPGRRTGRGGGCSLRLPLPWSR